MFVCLFNSYTVRATVGPCGSYLQWVSRPPFLRCVVRLHAVPHLISPSWFSNVGCWMLILVFGFIENVLRWGLLRTSMSARPWASLERSASRDWDMRSTVLTRILTVPVYNGFQYATDAFALHYHTTVLTQRKKLLLIPSCVFEWVDIARMGMMSKMMVYWCMRSMSKHVHEHARR
jgi:hypothetical protein